MSLINLSGVLGILLAVENPITTSPDELPINEPALDKPTTLLFNILFSMSFNN